MTSTPSTSSASETDAHPEVGEISALIEGILPVEQQEGMRAHLAECGLCADVRTSLDEIRETLGTLPEPVRMPEDVASRIDAALAAEALLDATAPGEESAPVSRETELPDPEAAHDTTPETAPARETEDAGSGHAPRAVSVSRETHGTDRPAGHPSGSTGPGRPSPAHGRRRARRWRMATLVAAASVAVLGIGGVTIQALSNSGGTSTTSSSPSDSSRKKASGRGDDDRQLEQRVQSLLSHQGGTPSESGPGTAAEKPSGSPTVDTKRSPSGDTTLREDRAGGAGTTPSCVRDGIRRSESPLAVDADASYEGRSGYLVVLPHEGGDPQRVDAYVVDPSCVSADPSEPGEVLLKRTYPRR